MRRLEITYDGHPVFARDVNEFLMEQNAAGQLTLTADYAPVAGPDIEGEPGDLLDDRYTDLERSLLIQRAQDWPTNNATKIECRSAECAGSFGCVCLRCKAAKSA